MRESVMISTAILLCMTKELLAGQAGNGSDSTSGSTAAGSGSGSGEDLKISPLAMILFGVLTGATAVGCVQILKRKDKTRKERVAQGMKAAIQQKEKDNSSANMVTQKTISEENLSDDELIDMNQEEDEDDEALDKVMALYKNTPAQSAARTRGRRRIAGTSSVSVDRKASALTKIHIAAANQDPDAMESIVSALDSGAISLVPEDSTPLTPETAYSYVEPASVSTPTTVLAPSSQYRSNGRTPVKRSPLSHYGAPSSRGRGEFPRV
eukprot:TRINITY_DN6206_c0_g1_i1.p1 TRINITY_DN6206_c0_g1~~TRINITY_DN6206_c0_g1_i1.p1  ORF type:complete len:267 (+),score=33.27 TRINITY_DN6206_c0_g1_i1:57-857(+)